MTRNENQSINESIKTNIFSCLIERYNNIYCSGSVNIYLDHCEKLSLHPYLYTYEVSLVGKIEKKIILVIRADTLLVIFKPHIWGKFEVNSSGIQSEYGETVGMRENTGQKNSEYGHFSRSEDL